MSKINLKERAAKRRSLLKNASDSTVKKRASERQALVKKIAGEDSIEKRAAKRQAILDSLKKNDLEGRAKARRAYFQGGPGVNDPQNLGYPQELKYPRMEVPVGGDSRPWEQKWFEEAAAVSKQKHGPTGVELELKKKLQRASTELRGLRAKAKGNPKLAAKFAAEIANDLNQVIHAMDKAGHLEEADRADVVLAEIAAFIADPTKEAMAEESKPTPKMSRQIAASLLTLAGEMEKAGLTEEASILDNLLMKR